MKKARIFYVMTLLMVSLSIITVGCGGKPPLEGKLLEDDQLKQLTNLYLNYLNSQDPVLISDIAVIYPDCINVDQAGLHLDEDALLNYLASYGIFASSLGYSNPDVFDASCYPLKVGAGNIYDTERKEDVPVAVDFSLEGPWNFTTDPDELPDTVGVAITEAVKEKFHDHFPAATHALFMTFAWHPITSFISSVNDGVLEYGRVVDSENIISYDQPDMLLAFPLEIGRTWQSSYQVNIDTEPITYVSISRKVLSKNRLLLRIGIFDNAYLVQEKRTHTINGKASNYIYYIWYVAYVGEVARIQSLENEADDTFSLAEAYRRLWYTSFSGPE